MRNESLRSDVMDFLIGTTHSGAWDGWYGPSGREGVYNYTLVRTSLAAESLKSIGVTLKDDVKISKLRENTEIKCMFDNGTEPVKPCEIKNSVCLFNIKDDPCEVNILKC